MTTVNTQSFYIDQVDDVTVVCFTVSTIVEHNCEFVSDELFEVVEYMTSSDPLHVVLDLWSVRQIDDWGLAMLRALYDTIESNGGSVVLCRLHPSVVEDMKETRFLNGFNVADTRSEAIQSYSRIDE